MDDSEFNKRKRGRKPKDKFRLDTFTASLLPNNSVIDDNIIVKFPISCMQLTQVFNASSAMHAAPQPYNKSASTAAKVYSATDIYATTSASAASDSSNASDINIGEDGSMQQCKCKQVKKQPRQIDIILNNKFGCNSDKIKVLAQICAVTSATNVDSEWYKSVDVACYRCCHKFDTTPWGIPVKYVNSKFYLTGIFCSPNCALGYILNDARNTETYWEKIALLHLLYYHVYGTYTNIVPSPDRICLHLFGGSIDIDTYRNITADNYKSYTLEFPPCNTIIPMLEEIYRKNNLFSSFLPNDKLKSQQDSSAGVHHHDSGLQHQLLQPHAQASQAVQQADKTLKLKRFTPINNTQNTLDNVLKIDN
jgi:hypothetical protein